MFFRFEKSLLSKKIYNIMKIFFTQLFLLRKLALSLSSALFLSLTISGQTQVIVPDNIVSGSLINSTNAGWRLHSRGNSNASLIATSDFGITSSFGPNSIRASRVGGSGINRSFLGYFEGARTLSSLSSFSWNRFSEQGNDSYLNIFITNGQAVATVVYQPTTILNAWSTFTFNNTATTATLTIRYNGQSLPISYANLISQFGTWQIYNHPLQYISPDDASDFIGGIVLVSGSSNPTAAQTHTFDGVSISFEGEAIKTFDFVAPPVIPPSGCFPISVVSYEPLNRQDGTPVLPSRQFFNNALIPQNSDATTTEEGVNFVSLGFGGQITLEMENPIFNGPGDDINVYETTFGSAAQVCPKSPEKIKAYASQDGCNFIYLGERCQNGSFDLGIFTWAKFLKFVDCSNINSFFSTGSEGSQDGYDLDGIECTNGIATDLTPANLVSGYLTQAVDFTPNTEARRKNNSLVFTATPNRRVLSNMFGAPQNNNTINFFTLGFGGFVTVKFDYIVFDGPGNDLRIYETSFGNPTCNNYPERALYEISLDGLTWAEYPTICQDGFIDISATGFQGIQYVRISDRSPISSNKFPGTADGYDIDGIVDLHACSASVGKYDANSNEEIVEGSSSGASIYPNPANELINVSFINESSDNEVSISVHNLMGAVVFTKTYSIQNEAFFNQILDLNQLSSGIYVLRISSASIEQSEKIIKN